MIQKLPSPAQAKQLAHHFRTQSAGAGTPISYAKSLELVAHHYGFRDWNTLRATIGDQPPSGWSVGQKVTGTYLSKSFEAQVLAMGSVEPGWFRLELSLDEPVDVVTSDRFSNFRKRVRGVVGPKGHSRERTSDGRPHLQIDL